MNDKPRQGELRLAVAPLTRVDVRDASATGDGSWTMGGYAAVYDQETTLFEIPGWLRVREEIAPGAFRSVLDRVANGQELVHLNHGHDMKTAVAATDAPEAIGRLELSEDAYGLRYFARVDQEDPDARALAVKMRRGVIRQSSFAFTIADEDYVAVDDGETYDVKYTINEIGHLYDVCACAQGAYPQTESYLRSLAAASLRVPDLGAPGRDSIDLSGHGRRIEEILGGGSHVAPAASAGGSESRRRELLRLQAHAATVIRERRAA